MIHLVGVSLIWALSFGLIKHHLAGVDPSLVAAVRVTLSLAFFLPLLRPRDLSPRLALALAGIGLVQYGLMYLFYIRAFGALRAHEVALFTVVTPLWVTLLDDARRRRCSPVAHLAAALAVAGTALVLYREGARAGIWGGFALVQLSNACFAVGQVAYRELRRRHPSLREARVYALLYAGAVAAAAPAAALSWDGSLLALSGTQAAILVYLGVVASGLGFFWWNVGATRVGAGVLGVLNNAKVPLGVAASLVVFGERPDVPRLVGGGAVVALALALAFVRERRELAPARGRRAP